MVKTDSQIIFEVQTNVKFGAFCYICGRTDNLTFHHLKDLGSQVKKHKHIIVENLEELGIITNTKDNCVGMPLCRTCHDMVEAVKNYTKNRLRELEDSQSSGKTIKEDLRNLHRRTTNKKIVVKRNVRKSPKKTRGKTKRYSINYENIRKQTEERK